MAKFITIHEKNPDLRLIKEVVSVLKQGGLVICPTDTVYALVCDINNVKGLERMAKIKGVKLEKANFSFICHDLSHLSHYTKQIDTTTFKILNRSFPGPYTFILRSGKTLPKQFKKRKTVGIRIPDNNITLSIVKELGRPVVSASIHDKDKIIDYTTDPRHILEAWDHVVELVIDSGYGGNMPSTIIDLSEETPIVLREGKGDISIF